MGDSSSSNFSSLLELANAHLSKTELTKKGTQLKNPTDRLGIASTSETILAPLRPKQGSSVLNVSSSTSSIMEVLSRQMENMWKRKEEEELKKKEEEFKKKEEELKKQEEELLKKEEEKKMLVEKMEVFQLEDQDDYVVDLMKALETPYVYDPLPSPKKELSNSNSFESLFDLQDPKPKVENPKTLPQLLPCTTDISYILKQKVFRGKCSPFGKVLISRLKPVAAPYIFERYDTVKPFDFKTKSPCDLILEERSRPSRYNAYDYDIMKIIMGDYEKK